MLSFMRRIAIRLTTHETSDDRAEAPARGTVARMMHCDMNNLDRLTRALAEPRR